MHFFQVDAAIADIREFLRTVRNLDRCQGHTAVIHRIHVLQLHTGCCIGSIDQRRITVKCFFCLFYIPWKFHGLFQCDTPFCAGCNIFQPDRTRHIRHTGHRCGIFECFHHASHCVRNAAQCFQVFVISCKPVVHAFHFCLRINPGQPFNRIFLPWRRI